MKPRQACLPNIQLVFGAASLSFQQNIFKDRETTKWGWIPVFCFCFFFCKKLRFFVSQKFAQTLADNLQNNLHFFLHFKNVIIFFGKSCNFLALQCFVKKYLIILGQNKAVTKCWTRNEIICAKENSTIFCWQKFREKLLFFAKKY